MKTHTPQKTTVNAGLPALAGEKVISSGLKGALALACACLLGAGLLPLPATAGPNLDPTFGNGGKVVTSFAGGLDTAQSVAVQTDGKLVVAGSSGSDFALTRYNLDGSLDTSFGTGGRVHTDFPVGQGGLANAMILQLDGKIVLAGLANDPGTNNSVFALARYNTDGSLDASFGTGGRVTTMFSGSNAQARAMARQSDGKLVVAGVSTDTTTNNSVFALARYNTNGSLDTTFDGDGLVTTDFAGVTFETANAVAVQADGRIVAAGLGSSSFAVARYLTNGSLDPSFDGDGKLTTAFGGSFEEARAIAIQVDGKIIVAGETALSVAAEINFAIARYNTDGSLDNTFDGDGKVTTDFGLVDGARAIVIQPDGRIVAAGTAGTIAGGSFFAVARYNTNGSLDGSFDGDGKALTDFSGGRFSLGALGVALQADGRIVAVGDANISGQRDFGVARYNTNGSLDVTFGAAGKVITDFPLNDEGITGLVIQPDGKVIAAGRFNSRIFIRGAQDPNFELARYNTDGTLDLTFGTGGLVSTDFPSNSDDFANAVAVQADGRIVVVGQTGPTFSVSTGDTAFGIVRYNTDGSLDTTFGIGGRVSTDFGTTHDSAVAVAVQADGKIVVVGSNGSAFLLARYNSNGSLDTSGFGTGGKVTTDFGGGFVRASAIVIQPDGRIVAAGSAASNFALARYNTDGGLDGSFGGGGKVITDFNGDSDRINGLVIQPDGKLVATGEATSPATGTDFALARYNTNGTLDSGFGSGGKVTTDFGGFDSAAALALQKDGGFVVAGLFFPTDGTSKIPLFALARYNSAGNIDPAFGSGGKVTTDFFGVNNEATAVALQGDGRIVVGGFADTGSSNDFALARYTFLPAQLLNISTRLRVLTGDKMEIGGFIVTGSGSKKVVVRGKGPSLPVGVMLLADPMLELHDANGIIATNNDWKINDQSGLSQEAEVRATGFAPNSDFESVIIATLPANGARYTAILRGSNGGTGVGLVEVYDISQGSTSQLGNVSTRGFVDTGDNVMIGGFIAGPNTSGSFRILVLAVGPSMAVGGALQDPTLALHDGNGNKITSNDNWKIDEVSGQSQEAAIRATGMPPGSDQESALLQTLTPGAYTAIVRGKGETTGIGAVQIYNLP